MTEVSPATEMNETEASSVYGEAERDGVIEPGEEEAQGESYQCV